MKVHEAQEATVELNDRETETKDTYDFYSAVLRYPKREAATEALSHHKGQPSKEFVEWLSEGTLTKDGGEVVPAEVNDTADSAA
jgi:hypothetical protein